jgi:hypothetical protein
LSQTVCEVPSACRMLHSTGLVRGGGDRLQPGSDGLFGDASCRSLSRSRPPLHEMLPTHAARIGRYRASRAELLIAHRPHRVTDLKESLLTALLGDAALWVKNSSYGVDGLVVQRGKEVYVFQVLDRPDAQATKYRCGTRGGGECARRLGGGRAERRSARGRRGLCRCGQCCG